MGSMTRPRWGADFHGADLRRASFEGASVEGVRWVGAIHDKGTIWPDGAAPRGSTDE
jgi:hypothetical protein